MSDSSRQKQEAPQNRSYLVANNDNNITFDLEKRR